MRLVNLWPLHYSRNFSDPFGNGSGTCPFGKNSDMLLQIGNFHRLVRCLFWYVLAHIIVGFFLFSVEIVRAGRIHKRHAFDYIAMFIKTFCPIWEIFLSYWDFFHQNWEKYILFCIGNESFYGTQIYRQKNPCTPSLFPFGVEYAPPGLEHLLAIVVTDDTPDEPWLLYLPSSNSWSTIQLLTKHSVA